MAFPNDGRRFAPGKSGNPNGRPRTADLKTLLENALTREENGKMLIDHVINALYKQAKKGNVAACRELLDRAYGKPQASIDHSSGGYTFAPIFHVMTAETAAEIERIAGDD